MFNLTSGRRRRSLYLYMGLALSAGLGACSTSNTIKVAQAAPITYKIGQGDIRQASTTLSHVPSRLSTRPEVNNHRSPNPYTPPSYTPRSYTHQSAVPTPRALDDADNFDISSIDRTLYKHQKVGKRYTVLGKSYTPKHTPDYDVIGTASWYGDKFHGKPTATGETFDKNDLTAAHKTLPLNSYLRVTNMETGKVLMVRLNDRGPFIGDRIIDLSEASARALGTLEHGLGKVRVQYAGPADPAAAKRQFVAPPRPSEQASAQNEYIAQAPADSHVPATPPATNEYRPLREPYSVGSNQATENGSGAMPYIPPIAEAPIVPTAPDYSQDPAHRTDTSEPRYMPEANAPYQQPELPDDGSTITLTIKGPVHMATTRSEVKKQATKPRFIPAVNKQLISTKTNK